MLAASSPSSSLPPAASLLQRVASGEVGAMEALMERNGALVRSLARRFHGKRHDVEDAVQEIFVAIWGSARRFDPRKGSESGFVATVARRRLIDRLRKSERRPEASPLEEVHAPPAVDETRMVDIRDESEHVKRALGELSAPQQLVLELSFLHGASHSRIARRTRLPLGTVKSHARRGLERLREKVVDAATPDATFAV